MSDLNEMLEETPAEAPVVEVEQEAEQPVEVPAEQPAPAEKQETVPLATFLDQRDEIKRLKAQQQPQEQVKAPDPIEDPEGYTQYTQQSFQAAIYKERLNVSEMFARQSVENFDEIRQWAITKCDDDKIFNARMANSSNPWGDAVAEWKREQVFTQFGSDPQSIEEKIKARVEEELQKRLASQETETQPAPAAEKLPSDFSKGQGGGTKPTQHTRPDLDQLLA